MKRPKTRKDLYLILDTETTRIYDKRQKKTVNLAYDISYLVVDNTGKIYHEQAYAVKDIFTYRKDLMKTAYYKEKLPLYYEALNDGKYKLAMLKDIWHELNSIVSEYKIKAICAYNASFDFNTLNSTIAYVTKGKYKDFFMDGIPWLCIWVMAGSAIMSKNDYVRFCMNNSLYTHKGSIRSDAETCFSYIIGNPLYKEVHIGIEDCYIEAEIFVTCFNRKVKLERKASGQGWRYPKKTFDKILAKNK